MQLFFPLSDQQLNRKYHQVLRFTDPKIVTMLSLRQSVRLLTMTPKVLANSIYTSPRTLNVNPQDSQSRIKKLLDMLESRELKDPPEFVSDIEEDLKEVKRRRQIEQKEMEYESQQGSVMLFPGQGHHFVGMGKELLQHKNVKEMYEVASDILGYDLLDLCLNGPHQKLGQTIHSQPATVVTSLAAIEGLRATHPAAIDRCVTAAGYSVGEISALVFADALQFEDAVRLVETRAELMQADCDRVNSGMTTVKLRADSDLNYAMKLAQQYCKERLNIEDPVCRVAIDLYIGTKIIGGHVEALDFIEENCEEFGIRSCQRVDVSGAFHTPLMKEASAKFGKYLEDIEIRKPVISVHSNVTRFPYRSSEDVRKYLAAHLVEKVQWEQIMHAIYKRPSDDDFPLTYEVGPGKRLGIYLRSINSKAYRKNYIFVSC